MPFAVLLAALAEVPDPRRAQGQRYSMSHLLLFSVLAVLTGATSYQKIIAFIALQRERLNAVFGACFRRAPVVNTLRHLFLALDGGELEAAFRRHACELNARSTPEALRTVALDGKTLRGSFDHLTDRKAVHVLSAFASDAALILAQCRYHALLRRRAFRPIESDLLHQAVSFSRISISGSGRSCPPPFAYEATHGDLPSPTSARRCRRTECHRRRLPGSSHSGRTR